MRRTSVLAVAWRVGAGLVLAAFVVGLPVVLARFGSPLPSRVPTWSGLVTDLRIGYVPSAVLAKVALGAAWAVWMFLGYEIAAETASWIRNQAARRSSALGPLQPLLSRLVAAAVLSAPLPARVMAGAATPALRPPVVALDGGPAPTPAPASPVPTTASTTLPSYVVQPHDTLWGIAERHLGDPLRWSEIAALNEGRAEGSARFEDPHWIYPGWTLLLPADATTLPAAPPPVPASGTPQPTATPPAPTPVAPKGEDAIPAPDGPTPTRAPVATVRPESASADGTSGSPWGTPSHAGILAIGSGLLAAGVREAIARKRKAQQRRRRPGRRIPLPTGALRDVETALFAGSDAEVTRWAERTVRLLARALHGAEDIPTVLGLLVRPHAVEVLLESPAPAPPPFGEGAEGRWVLERSAEVKELDDEARRYPGVLAALVTMGRSTDGVVLLNLEAGGIVSITAPSPQAGRELASAMALELATAPWVDALELCTVGIEERAFSGLDTLELFSRRETLSEAIGAARHHARDIARCLAEIDEHDAAVVRLRDLVEGFSPLVVICGEAASEEEARELSQLGDTQRLALAVVVAGEIEAARWQFVLSEDGVLRVEPLGIELSPQRLRAEELSGIGDLLSLASRRDDLSPDAPPYDTIVDPVCDEETLPTPERAGHGAENGAGAASRPLLSLVGPVQLEGVSELTRGRKMVEFVAFLATHPQGADLDTIAAALWPESAPSERSIWNLSSAVRRALGTDASGEPHLSSYRRLRLGAGVEIDWARFCALARSSDPDSRRAALDIVRGRPFADVDWPWATTEGIAAAMEDRIADLAAELAAEALGGGELDEARCSAEHGLLARPYDERLYRVLMEVAAAKGGVGEVREVMRRLGAVLEAEVEPEGVVEEETWALYQCLSHPPPRRRARPEGRAETG